MTDLAAEIARHYPRAPGDHGPDCWRFHLHCALHRLVERVQALEAENQILLLGHPPEGIPGDLQDEQGADYFNRYQAGDR